MWGFVSVLSQCFKTLNIVVKQKLILLTDVCTETGLYPQTCLSLQLTLNLYQKLHFLSDSKTGMKLSTFDCTEKNPKTAVAREAMETSCVGAIFIIDLPVSNFHMSDICFNHNKSMQHRKQGRCTNR